VRKLKTNVERTKASSAPDKLANLKKRDYIIGDSDDIVHMDWSSEWSELKNLDELPHDDGSDEDENG